MQRKKGDFAGEVAIFGANYLIIYAFFPVAIFEEAFGRGYMLDRLMPHKPSGMKEDLPERAIAFVQTGLGADTY